MIDPHVTRFNIHQVEIIQTGLDHPECVNFGPDGRLYAGGFHGQVYAMSPPKFELVQVCDTGGYVGGVAVDGNHNVYACNVPKGVVKVAPDGKLSRFCDEAPGGALVLANYGAFDAVGNYYFSDSGDYWRPSGRLIRVKRSGKAESLIGGNWHFPNGLALSPDRDAIYLIESTAADILRISLNKDGSVSPPEIFVQMQGNVLDGLAFARGGNLYVSCYYPNRIYLVSPDRNVELLIEDMTGEILNQPTNVAFEPEGTRLFIASLGGQHVAALDVGEKGAALSYPKI